MVVLGEQNSFHTSFGKEQEMLLPFCWTAKSISIPPLLAFPSNQGSKIENQSGTGLFGYLCIHTV